MKYKIITEKEIITKEITEVEVTLLGYIGHKVTEARKEADINIAQLSRRLANEGVDLSGTTIGRIEKGVCSLKVMDLVAIGDFLGIKFSSFFPAGINAVNTIDATA